VLESEAELKEALLSGDPWLLQVPSHHHVSCADGMRLRDRQCVNETTPVFAVTADAKKLLLAGSDVKVAALNCHKQERACCTLRCLQPSALHARRSDTPPAAWGLAGLRSDDAVGQDVLRALQVCFVIRRTALALLQRMGYPTPG
jgi:hypothetical protein